MRISPDKALENFVKISKINLGDASESDTRSKIIDRILKESLNWQDDDISREEPGDSGYADYILRLGQRNVLIIEAKKKGFSFKLPIQFGLKRDYSLNGVLKKDTKLVKTINQARNYCNDKGVRFGAISNGDQFVVFDAKKPGHDWRKGKSKVFYSFHDIKSNFIDFWNLLSKDAVENGSLVDSLTREEEEFKFIKPVDGIRFKNETQPRNELYRYMIPIIQHTFREMTDQKRVEMLKECYVLENESKETSITLRSCLSDSLADLSFKKIEQDEEHAGVFHMDFYKHMESVREAPPDPIICLLLGKIGSGKTTFIFRFFNIVLDEEERKRVKWFYVDFRNAPVEEESIRSYILKSILDEFRIKYGELLDDILGKLKIKTVEPKIEDISRLFLMLKYENYVPSLVIDNVDQHRVKSSIFHEKVFLEANNLTKVLRTITIMTLREESFYRSSTGGVFNAYYIDQYHIFPPDLRKMLLKRLDYILRKLELPKDEMEKWFNISANFERQIDKIRDFLKIIKDTVEARANRSVSKFVSKTSGGNMRRALELFANFLVSGNTKIREILDTYHREGSYIIAEHQFIRSIILGNYRYYSKNSSYLMNIFDLNIDLTKSHFLKLKILNYAEDKMAVDSPYGGGYISINKVIEEASNISISHKAMEDSILQLAKYGLILLNTRSKTDMEGASHFRITECGSYFLHILMKRFSYVDLVLADTPTADVDVSLRIRQMLPSRELDTRFKRTSLFINYLNEMEKREFENKPENRLSELGKYKFAQGIMSSFRREERYIQKRIGEKLMSLDHVL